MKQLQKKVAADGSAKAIVFVRREHVAESGPQSEIQCQLDEHGRMRRTLPSLNKDVFNSLQQHFVAEHPQPMVHFPFLDMVHGVVDAKGLENLANHEATHSLHHAPELSAIQPVATEEAAAPSAGPAWGISRLKAPEIWQRGYTGQHIVVAHLDSGVDSTHPALRDALDKYAVFDVSGQSVAPPDPYAGLDEHGTHTAGTIAARSVANAPVVGMAPDAELIDATVVGGTATDSVSRVLAGLNWSLEKGARVVSLSVGFDGYDESFLKIIDTLRAQHLLPIVAIGNDGKGRSCSPGNYANVLSVGAISDSDYVEGFSGSPAPGSAGSGPKVCAPGFRIKSAKPGGGYRLSSGTSMATPHIAGLAALLLSARPQASIDQVERAIVASCTNPMQESAERIGAGIPDGIAALDALLQGAN
jgi:subtilisin family serine protease